MGQSKPSLATAGVHGAGTVLYIHEVAAARGPEWLWGRRCVGDQKPRTLNCRAPSLVARLARNQATGLLARIREGCMLSKTPDQEHNRARAGESTTYPSYLPNRNKQESSPVKERSSFDRQAETLVDSVGSAPWQAFAGFWDGDLFGKVHPSVHAL